MQNESCEARAHRRAANPVGLNDTIRGGRDDPAEQRSIRLWWLLIWRLGVVRAWRAAVMIGVCLLISALASAVLRQAAHPLLLKAYSRRFSFMPGHWFGARVAQLSAGSSNACIIIGTSNAREGFDPVAIKAALPHIDILNAATTGGNNEVLEVQSAILKQHGIAPRCVIAGATTWMMFRDGTPSITGEEYLGLMEWNNVLGLSARPLLSKEGPRVVMGLILPLRSQARQLNRVTRDAIMSARAASIGSLPVRRYETYKDELKPTDEYLYLNTPSHLMKDWGKLVEQTRPLYPASRYGGAVQERSLRATLDRLLSITPNVILVITPQTPILAPASQSGAPHFWRVIDDYKGGVTVIDCSGFRDLALFVDEGHLNATGRNQLSTEIGEMLRVLLSGAAPVPTQHCVLVRS